MPPDTVPITVAFSPTQIVSPVAEAVGAGKTVTVTSSESVHPLLAVAVKI